MDIRFLVPNSGVARDPVVSRDADFRLHAVPLPAVRRSIVFVAVGSKPPELLSGLVVVVAGQRDRGLADGVIPPEITGVPLIDSP
ncbi:MAG: hypothetical protein P8Y29_01150 [Gemmatimonadota bacterium]